MRALRFSHGFSGLCAPCVFVGMGRFCLVPQERIRVYLVGVHKRKSKTTKKQWSEFVNKYGNALEEVKSRKLAMRQLSEFLLPNTALGKSYLAQMRKKARKLSEEHDSLMTGCWRSTHTSFFLSNRVKPSEVVASEKVASMFWYEHLTPRMKVVLAFWCCVRGLAAVDLSQSIDRVFKSQDGILVPTLTPKMLWFDVSAQRPLMGIEHLALQGFEMATLLEFWAQGTTDGLFRDLAGNSFSSICFAVILICLCLNMPVNLETLGQEPQAESSDEDVLTMFD